MANVSNAAVTKLSLPMLAEAAPSFLLYGDPGHRSWGQLIRWGLTPDVWFDATWWSFAFPALTLVATVLAFDAVGDALRDALDPRSVG